jgi:hypothetical protein
MMLQKEFYLFYPTLGADMADSIQIILRSTFKLLYCLLYNFSSYQEKLVRFL